MAAWQEEEEEDRRHAQLFAVFGYSFQVGKPKSRLDFARCFLGDNSFQAKNGLTWADAIRQTNVFHMCLGTEIEFFQAEPIAHKPFLNVDDQAWHPGNVLEPCAAHTVFGTGICFWWWCFGVSDFSAPANYEEYCSLVRR